jgi:uncharacterized protein YdeI (YjbR/CyaY-like superfamily)
MASVPPDSVHPLTRSAWRDWLSEHHTRQAGVWFISFKKASGRPRVSYDESVEEALCFGWIDSKPNKLDDERTMLWFAPRKAGTGWSKPNKDRVERLIAAGRMEPAGLAKVRAAQEDGSWSALDGVEALAVPDDLRIALGAYPAASANFDAFPRSVKRGILEWILNARRPETRAARIAESARLTQDGERANQWRPKG